MSEKSDSFTKKSWRTIAQEQKIVRNWGVAQDFYTLVITISNTTCSLRYCH